MLERVFESVSVGFEGFCHSLFLYPDSWWFKGKMRQFESSEVKFFAKGLEAGWQRARVSYLT